MSKTYLVSLLEQEKEVTEYCFDKCGKILMRIANVEGGSFLPCKQEECPYVDESFVLSDKITVGKLKEIHDPVKQKTKAEASMQLHSGTQKNTI